MQGAKGVCTERDTAVRRRRAVELVETPFICTERQASSSPTAIIATVAAHSSNKKRREKKSLPICKVADSVRSVLFFKPRVRALISLTPGQQSSLCVGLWIFFRQTFVVGINTETKQREPAPSLLDLQAPPILDLVHTETVRRRTFQENIHRPCGRKFSSTTSVFTHTRTLLLHCRSFSRIQKNYVLAK